MMRGSCAALAAVIVLFGCSGSAKPAAPTSAEALFDRAAGELATKHYTEASEDFERFTLEYPTHPKVQEARFHIGEAYLGKKEYVTAAAEFTRLATDYPSGGFADDARFKVCEAYSRLSPVVQLDQQYTKAAIDHCEALVTYYPTSELVPRAQEIAKALREKLAEKMLLAGEFYFRRRAYDSAILYFDSTLKDYPSTSAAPKALLRTVETYQKLGYKEEAQAAKERLLKEYPGTSEAKEAQSIPLAQSTQ
jgi:outer membrane protein assembly factor BamD